MPVQSFGRNLGSPGGIPKPDLQHGVARCCRHFERLFKRQHRLLRIAHDRLLAVVGQIRVCPRSDEFRPDVRQGWRSSPFLHHCAAPGQNTSLLLPVAIPSQCSVFRRRVKPVVDFPEALSRQLGEFAIIGHEAVALVLHIGDLCIDEAAAAGAGCEVPQIAEVEIIFPVQILDRIKMHPPSGDRQR